MPPKNRLRVHLKRAILVIALTVAHTSPALTTLFEERFPQNISRWKFGSTQAGATLGTGDTFAFQNGALAVKDVYLYVTHGAPFIFHATDAMNFRQTQDKIIQLSADINIGYPAASYRMGLFDTTTSTYQVTRNAVALRIFPSSSANNVEILVFDNAGGARVVPFTTPVEHLMGAHRFSLQIDYTQSISTPTVRAYSNGKLIITPLQLTATEGIHPNPTSTATQATQVRVFFQANPGPVPVPENTSERGANFQIDNVIVTSFTPGTILLSELQNSSAVNRKIFGQSIVSGDGTGIFTGPPSTTSIRTAGGAWDPNANAPSPVILNKIKNELKTGVLRYPGGCLSHNFDWTKTVGPLNTRASTDWRFGIDEFMRLCNEVGAEPIITLSDYVLSAEDMPHHLAQLVEYLNGEANPANPQAWKRSQNGHHPPYKVKYFELGNESMHGNHQVSPSRKFSPAQYSAYANASAWAMRAVDPSIAIGIVMNPSGGQDVYCQWNTEVMAGAGKAADFVVLHTYAPRYADGDSGSPEETTLLQACMAYGEQLDKHLDDFHEMIVETVGHDLPLAITEFNAILTNPALQELRYSYGPALECADLWRVFLKRENGILLSSYWNLLNDYFGALSFPVPASENTILERPAYHLFELWGQHFGEVHKYATVNGPRANFEGTRRVYPATGNNYLAATALSSVSMASRFYTHHTQMNGPQLAASMTGQTPSSVLSVHLTGLTEAKHAFLGSFTSPSPMPDGRDVYDYRLTLEARYTPDAATQVPVLNMLLQDSRNWSSTLAYGIAGPVISSQWKEFTGELTSLPDAVGEATLLQIIASPTAPATGLLEIKNAVMETVAQPRFPAYNLITASASASADANKLYLIVFNKSDLHIPMTVNFPNFSATSAKRWEINGPNMTAKDGVGLVASNEPTALASSTSLAHVFPSHSMTAIELYK